MYGQKEIISCMVIVTMVAILNYYKSIIKRDKEIQNVRRHVLEKQRMDEQLLEAERVAVNHAMFLGKMLEYSDRCNDIHALIYRPRDYDFEEEIFSVVNSTETDVNAVSVSDFGCNLQTEKKEFMIVKEREGKMNKKTNEKADTSSIVYVLVAVLLGSLVKAALDLTKHYKKKDNNETENDILRRCSLQEYSLLKHKQKNQSKAEKPITFLLLDFGIFTLKKVEFSSNWLSENCSHLLWPSMKGFSWTLASRSLLYLDSDKPGVNPPATLSPSRTVSGNCNRTSSHHIGYLTSLAVGVVIFSLNLSNE